MSLSCRKWLLLLGVLFITTPSFAQNDDDAGIVSENEYTRHFMLGIGGVRQSFRDESISSLVYTGYGVAPSFGHVKKNEVIYSELFLQGSKINTKRKGNDLIDREAKVWRAALDYKVLFRMPVINEYYDLRVGGAIGGMFCYKHAPQFENAGKIYEYAATLGGAATFGRQLYMWERNCRASIGLTIPLLARFARPTYLNQVKKLSPGSSATQDYFGTNTTAFFGKYMGIRSEMSFTYPLSNGNEMALSYNWDYYKMESANDKVYFVEHLVSLTYLFNY